MIYGSHQFEPIRVLAVLSPRSCLSWNRASSHISVVTNYSIAYVNVFERQVLQPQLQVLGFAEIYSDGGLYL